MSETPTGASDDANDPFSPENIGIVHFIMQARIYDVLMALLTTQNGDMAKNLLELHAQGSLMGSSPSFTGAFVADEVKDED